MRALFCQLNSAVLAHVIAAVISQLASISCNELADEDDVDDDSTNFGAFSDL